MLRACVSLPCPVSSSLGIQGSLCEIFLQDKGQDIESVHCEKRVCVSEIPYPHLAAAQGAVALPPG